MILEASARFAAPYGGIIAFSGGVIGSKIDTTNYQGQFNGTKISENDPHIPLVRAKDSQQILQLQGASVEMLVYPGSSHTIREEEIKWVKKHAFS